MIQEESSKKETELTGTTGTENIDPARARLRKQYFGKQRRMKIWTIVVVIAFIIYAAVGVFALRFGLKLLETTPELDIADLVSEESSRIYDSSGALITEIGTYYRKNITYDQCPESLVDAFLSIEDSRFFQHNGFDIPRFTKAALEVLATHHFGSGGSTFTMQLVKNTYFSIDAGDESTERTKSLEYKAQQIWLSMKLETLLSKQEIFELYVNKLNFGGRIRGVQKAAEYYFGKDVTQLTLSESALLAGIVNLPNEYNPYRYLDYATTRRNNVLRLMYEHGYITKEQQMLARSIRVEDQLVGEDKMNVESTKYPAYIDAAIEEVLDMTGYDPVTKGMEIYTGLVPTIQERIEDIESEDYGIAFPDELMQISICSVNNQTGEIVGISGGRNYSGGRALNRATSQYKQPGSSVKPFLDYALAFEYLGYSLDEILLDKPITFPGESRVLVNATGTYVGDITIKDAVATSLNIPAILTLEAVTSKIGSEAVVDYLHNIGFTRASNETFHMSYAIGGNLLETTAKELAGAHAAMINYGVYNEPHCVNKVILSSGEVYYPDNQNRRVLSSGSAWLVCQLMEYNVSSGIFNYMHVLRRDYPVYAKTGTTDWGSDGVPYGIPQGAAKDKWMVSSTSQYTNAVWIGYDKAEKDMGTYFPAWKSQLNIPGRVNIGLLDIEHEVSPDTEWGVARPADVEDVQYIYGTYPHVSSYVYGGQIVSQVSSTGLANQPTISAGEYGQYHSAGKPTMTSIDASISNGMLYINWKTGTGCYGGVRDISLHDSWNNIPMTGRCIVDTSWLYSGGNNTYIAEIYQDDAFVGSVTSSSSSYTGMPVPLKGQIKVCGYYYNGAGSSQKVCTDAGFYDPDAEKEEDKKDEKDEKDESSEHND